MLRPPPPAYETAWERGLRQAKEMRRRSHKRREMDVEYEEKKASLSLTQVSWFFHTYFSTVYYLLKLLVLVNIRLLSILY